MKNTIKIAICFLVTLIALQSASAQVGAKKATPDERVEKLFRELELEHTIDKDGDFRLELEFSDERSQVAFVDSRTHQLGALEIRNVWSLAHVVKEVSAPVMRNLLEENHQLKLGAWKLMKFQGNDAVVLSAQIAADTDKKSLYLAIQAVMLAADEMEEKLSGKDEL